MGRKTTMLDLIVAIQDSGANDREVVSTVVHLVNSGMVRLSGTFKEAIFDLAEIEPAAIAAA
jgi:hypothetical protein